MSSIVINKERNNSISVTHPVQNKVSVSSAVIQTFGAPSGEGDKSFVYNFTNLSWSQAGNEFYIEITHNLNKYPSVSVIDSVNNVVYTSVEYINLNRVKIYTTSIFSGKSYLN